MTKRLRVVIAGGGIGGLTLAAALRRTGHEVVVLERAPALRPVGAGILLAINALMALRRVGTADRVMAVGQPVERAEVRDFRGALLQSTHFDALRQEVGVPALAFYRAELHDALLGALPPDAVQLGREVIGYEQHNGRVRARLSDGTTEEGDLLVGADGLRSKVREGVVGPTPLLYSGQTSWRAVTGPNDLLAPGTSVESWGPGRRFGMVSLSGGRTYWYAVADAPQGEQDAPGVRGTLLDAYRGWHVPITQLLELTDEASIFRTDLHDRAPVPKWSQGRVTLLGDAAHPMTPNMGQGACQAIEDALVLSDALVISSTIEDALRRYEERRIARTSRMVVQSRRIGRISQWDNPVGRWARNKALRMVPERAMVKQMRKLLLTPDVMAPSPPPATR